MLVKITKFPDGWQIRALGGPHYNEIVGVAQGVVLQNARLAKTSITGDLISTWDLQMAPHCLNTSTQRSLSPRKDKPELFKVSGLRRKQDGFFAKNTLGIQYRVETANRFCAVGDAMSYDRPAGLVPVEGV